jgi:hypothetical protein
MCRTPIAILVVCIAAPLAAQDVRVEVATQEPPHYAGEPVVIQFTVEGFDQEPQPTCTVDTPSGQLAAGLRGQMAAANPNVFSQIIQRGGQLYRSTRVTYQIQYLVTADEPGEHQVGPFAIKQGNKLARAEAVPMTFQTVPTDPNMRIRLVLPDKPVYPDQRVPVGIEWWYAEDLDNVLKLSIYSPMFDQFHFAPDPPASRRTSQLPIDTKEGRLSLSATAREEQHEGRRFVVLAANRTLLPDRPGEFTLPPITATLRKATERARSRSPFDDFFGGSLLDEMQGSGRPTRTALARAAGEPQKLIVKPFPAEGRPESFAGAVGSGFSIDVSADRTVVRVGDPIGLDITLRGDGNLENASLPALSADDGMSPDRFRLPDGDVSGNVADGAKRFHVSVRVTDESVAEIPALAYSWFDPDAEKYETAHSNPIALRVMPAQVVSAGDVVRGPGRADRRAASDDEKRQPAGGGDRAVATAAPNRPVYSLSGADLAIESDADSVLRDTHRGSSAVTTALYAVGFLLVAVALVDRRRRNVDPLVVARRKLLRSQQARIARAASRPKREAAEEIAAALRALLAEMPDIDRDGAQSVIAACEAIVYAPAGPGDLRLDEALVERSRRIAEQAG